MAQSKSTKKFEKRHLKDTLTRRKEFAKVKQRHQASAKKKAKRTLDAREGENEEPPAKKQKGEAKSFQDMSVDDFFAESVPLPKPLKSKIKRKMAQESDSESEGDGAFPDDELDESDGEQDHAEQLRVLAEKDPEFYKHLQKEDAELLDFKDDLKELDALLQNDEIEADTKTGDTLDIDTIRRWSKAMVEKHSLRAMRESVLAFRAAAHTNEEGKTFKYTVSDADVYNQVLVGALNHIPGVMKHHLPVKTSANGKMHISTDGKKFKSLSTTLKSHTISLNHLLTTLTDSATIRLTLSSILELTPYMLSFKKALRELAKTIIGLWSDANQDEAARVSAFLVIRRLSVIADLGIKDNVLRYAYQGFVSGSRITTIHTVSGINLMKNSALELWGLIDPGMAYTSAFNFVRQLAIHLRTAIKDNAKDKFRLVYNWQYVHSLDFWSRCLSTHCDSLREATLGKESPLRPLIYPLTQITLGALRLIPTSAYFPLRFHLIRALLRLSQSTTTYIPLAAPIFEVFQSTELRKAPRPSTVKPFDFEVNIHAQQSYLKTRVYQDGVGEEALELFSEFFFLWSKHIAFPELALPVVVMLRRWVKEMTGKSGQDKIKGGNRNTKLNSAVSLFIQKLEANTKFVEGKRARVDFAPNNRAGVESFFKDFDSMKTPLGVFVEGQRKQKEIRRQALEAARLEAKQSQKEEKETWDEVEDEDGNEDDDEEQDSFIHDFIDD